MVERYVPTVGVPDWDVKTMSKEQLGELKSQLTLGQVTTHEEFQTVIGYLYRKYPHEMDGVAWKEEVDGQVVRHPADTAIQWKYAVPKRCLSVMNTVTGKTQDMYAFVVYDVKRDMEPVAFAGSYFMLAGIGQEFHWDDALREMYAVDENGQTDPLGGYMRLGMGIVMFIDRHYRRLGLATDLWWAEAELYRQALHVRGQKEIQNEFSLQSTRKMFSDPNKCFVTSWGRLKNDGTHAGIRCIMDYEDEDLKKGFDGIPDGLKRIHAEADWRFLEREHMDARDLRRYWNK